MNTNSINSINNINNINNNNFINIPNIQEFDIDDDDDDDNYIENEENEENEEHEEFENHDSDIVDDQLNLTSKEKYDLMINKQKILNDITYEFCKHSICDLYDLYLKPDKNKKINLDPTYQRQFIWVADMQNKFIDSIMHNYVLQPIILIEIKDENTNKLRNYQSTLKTDQQGFEWECIDGRHRLKVIKSYIENIPVITGGHNIKYIKHILVNNNKSKNYNKLIKEMVHYEKLNEDDKKKFNQTSIPITKITIRINSKSMPQSAKILKTILKDMFLRLQTGVSVTTIDKFRNLEEPIIMSLHKHNLLMMRTFSINTEIFTEGDDIHNIWQIIPEIIDIPKPTISGINTANLAYITLFIITCLLIIEKKGNTLDIGSYLQLNIFKNIYKRYTPFNKITLEMWNNHIITLRVFLYKLYSINIKSSINYNKLKKIDKNIIYILLFQYLNTGSTTGGTFDKYIEYISNIRKVFYNDNGKSIFNTSPQQTVIDNTDFELFINIINTNLLYNQLNCNIVILRKQCTDKLAISKKLVPVIPVASVVPVAPIVIVMPVMPVDPVYNKPCRILKDCVITGTRIKHTINKVDVWDGIYNNNVNAIIFNNIKYDTLNKFVRAHYASSNKYRSCNAWAECYCEINNKWVPMLNLPVISNV